MEPLMLSQLSIDLLESLKHDHVSCMSELQLFEFNIKSRKKIIFSTLLIASACDISLQLRLTQRTTCTISVLSVTTT